MKALYNIIINKFTMYFTDKSIKDRKKEMKKKR